MASNAVQLTSGIRSNLLLLQKTTSILEATQVRLSTGNKINSALDGPANFFAAKGLNQRASDLNNLKDGIGQAISTLKAADTGITSIESLTEQARGLTIQALGSLGNDASSVSLRRNLANQFNGLIRQIDKLAGDSGYQGKNLLVGSGLQIDATSSSKLTVNNVIGVSGARTTNVTEADTYAIRVLGDGAISGSSSDVVAAESARGISNLEITGFANRNDFNFDNITVKLAGGQGKDKTFTITEAGETYTQTFTVSQWDAAEAAGKVLRLSYAFDSGTRISFDVNFDAIEDVADTAGVGTSVIEKTVNLEVQVTNGNGEVVTRDGLNLLGQGKVGDGENAFAFDSGTARITIDEAQILQASLYTGSASASYGTAGGAITAIAIGSAATRLSLDDTVTVTAVGAAYNYTTNNFGSFTTTLTGTNGGAASVANISAGALIGTYAASVGLNSTATFSLTFNVNELKLIATAAAANAAEITTTITQNFVSAGAFSVTTAGTSFADNTVTSVTISVTVTTGSSVTFQYTDQFGGTASISAALSAGTNLLIADNAAITFNVTGGSNSGATLTLGTITSTDVLANGTANIKVRGDFTGERQTKFDVRGSNAGQSATLTTVQVVDGNEANNLAVTFNETNTSGVNVISQNVRTDGQGLAVDLAQNFWLDRTDIDNAVRQLDAAKLKLRSASSSLSTNLNIIQTRETYTAEFTNVLTEGANKLIAADQNEEGANILSLQTKQQLGTIALSLANQAQQAILRLF
jgi:flagellin-like hook-associated protein FlgL